MPEADTNSPATSLLEPNETPGGLWRTAQRSEFESEYLPRLSRAALAVVAVLCLAWLLAGFARLGPQMVWGSLSMGRWIVEHQQLPGNDPLLAGDALAPGGEDHWLAQVSLYFLSQVAGIDGVLALHALLVAAAVGLTMLSLAARGAGAGWMALGGGLTLLVSLPMIHYVGPVWLAAVGIPMLLWMFRRLDTASWPAAAIPLTMLLWTNLHASVAVGLVLLLVLMACRSWQTLLGRGDRRREVTPVILRRSALAVGFSLVACLLSPEALAGVRGALAGLATNFSGTLSGLPGNLAHWPGVLLGDDSALVRPLELLSPAGLLVFGTLLLGALLLRRSPRLMRAEEVLLGLLTLVGVLWAQGAILWWAPVWAWIVIPHLAAWWGTEFRAADASLPALGERTTMQTLLAMAMVFAVLLITPCSNALIAGRPRGESQLTTAATPRYLAAELQRRQLAGRAYVPVAWADYLIWKTGGKLRPLARPGSRAALPGGWNDTLQLASGNAVGPSPAQPLWLRVAALHQLDYFVVDRRQNPLLRGAIAAHPRTDLLYPDQQAQLVRILPNVAIVKEKTPTG